MRTRTTLWAFALALLTASCMEWVPASAPTADGERYVRVHLASETTTLRAPSRRTLRELADDGARLEIRKLDGAATALATFGITVGVGLMAAFCAYAATRSYPWGNIQ